MSGPPKILVVDDTALNVKMLADILAFRGYRVATAAGGKEALAKVSSERPDLVLLDVMMPDMNGYEVCRAIRADPATEALPVVMVTALDPGAERVKGIEAGADDFLSKPVNQPELLARVKSLLRIKKYHDERLGRLKGFFSPQLAEALVSGGEELLRPHRREITAVFLDLRGFTAFTASVEPEEVMAALAQYHELVGSVVVAHQGTLERFAGDGMMIFFNDPIELPNATEIAVRMALELQRRCRSLQEQWARQGYELELGIGIAQGHATLGTIGFEGRRDYAAIGTVTNLAARLCGEARGGQILTDRRTLGQVEDLVRAEAAGELHLKGFARPMQAFSITGLRRAEGSLPA